MAKEGALDSSRLASPKASPAVKRTRRSTVATTSAADENVSLITRSLGIPTAQLDDKIITDQAAEGSDRVVFMSPANRTKVRSQVDHGECMDESKRDTIDDDDADEAVLATGPTDSKGHVCKECG
jgi:hypothetical protein